MQKNKSTSHKQYLCGLLFPGNPNKTQTDRSILKVLPCLKRNDSQIFKIIATAKNVFCGAYVIGTTLIDKCFYSMG